MDPTENNVAHPIVNSARCEIGCLSVHRIVFLLFFYYFIIIIFLREKGKPFYYVLRAFLHNTRTRTHTHIELGQE